MLAVRAAFGACPFNTLGRGTLRFPRAPPPDSLSLTGTAHQSEEIDVKYKKLTESGA